MVNDDRSRALEAAFYGKPKLDKAAAKTQGWRIELDRAACDIRSVDNQCNGKLGYAVFRRREKMQGRCGDYRLICSCPTGQCEKSFLKPKFIPESWLE
jgi:hypothetical protein